MKFQNSYLVNDRYALEVGKARPILRSHPLRLRSSAIRQDSDMTKAKVPHLHRALSAARPAEKHSAICSRYKSVVKSALPHLSPLPIWVPGGSKKTFSIQVNVGIKEKRKIKDDQGRSLWISVTKYCTQSPGHIGETVDIYCVKPGLWYTSGSVQGSQEAEAGVQGQPGLNSEMLSSQGKQTHLEFPAVSFHFSYLLARWEVLNGYSKNIYIFKKRYCVKTMATGATVPWDQK